MQTRISQSVNRPGSSWLTNFPGYLLDYLHYNSHRKAQHSHSFSLQLWFPASYRREFVCFLSTLDLFETDFIFRGGWFVLEVIGILMLSYMLLTRHLKPWITPSIFINTNNTDVVDEYTLGQLLGNDIALSILTPHWQTWITEGA